MQMEVHMGEQNACHERMDELENAKFQLEVEVEKKSRTIAELEVLLHEKNKRIKYLEGELKLIAEMD